MAVKESTEWVDMLTPLDWELDQRFEDTTAILNTGLHQASGVHLLNTRCRQRMVNLLPMKQDKKITLRMREKVANIGAFFDKSATVTIPRGIFFAKTIARMLELWDTTLYVWSANDTYTTVTSMGAETEGPGGFTEGINSSGAAYCFVACESKGVVVTTASNATVASNYPTDTIPMPVFLDSYVFIPQKSSRKIFNSNVGDPTTWATTTYIETEAYGGNIVGLVRHKEWVVALCENHIEFFRDAGVPAPNSPLQRVPELMSQIGCANRATIATFGDTTVFEGIDADGQVGIFIIEAGKISRISNPSIDFVLTRHGGDQGVFGSITAWSNSRTSGTNYAAGYFMPMYNKMYYCLILNAGMIINDGTTSMNSAISWLYDTDLKVWIELQTVHRDTGFTNTDVSGVWAFPFGTVVYSSNADIRTYHFIMQNAYGGTANNDLGALRVTDDSGDIVNADGGFFDAAVRTVGLLQWPLMDFGIPSRKQLSGLMIMDAGQTNNPMQVAGNLTPTFIKHGGYIVSSATPAYYSISLTHLNYTPPEGERTWLSERSFGSFFQNWFQLQFPLLESQHIQSIRVRITSYETA